MKLSTPQGKQEGPSGKIWNTDSKNNSGKGNHHVQDNKFVIILDHQQSRMISGDGEIVKWRPGPLYRAQELLHLGGGA